MIDTIVITLTKDLYHISEPDKFKPSAAWVNNPTAKIRGIQSKQNPTKKELLAGIYKPHLTIAHCITTHPSSPGLRRTSGSQIMLKIELSLPKLVFGNNVDELQYKDFKVIVPKLVNILEDMGVIVSAQTLTNAHVSAIHYSKNIPLTDGSIPYQYINKIKEANVKLSLDVNQTNYRNEGHSYKWHCNTYEVAFYDKIKELEKSDKNIIRNLRSKKKLEILRMEVRLNNRKRIRHLFKKLTIKAELNFKSLFKPAISKKVLLHYMSELESKRLPLIDFRATSDKALLVALLFNNPDLSHSKILQMYGLKKILEIVNIRELRNMLGANDRTWYRLISGANKVNLPASNSPFDVIRECINEFKPVKMSSRRFSFLKFK